MVSRNPPNDVTGPSSSAGLEPKISENQALNSKKRRGDLYSFLWSVRLSSCWACDNVPGWSAGSGVSSPATFYSFRWTC